MKLGTSPVADEKRKILINFNALNALKDEANEKQRALVIYHIAQVFPVPNSC